LLFVSLLVADVKEQNELLSLMYVIIAILSSVAIVVIITLIWFYRRRSKATSGLQTQPYN